MPFIFLVFFLSALTARAQGTYNSSVWLQGPNTSDADYANYLSENPLRNSFAQFQAEAYESRLRPLSQAIEVANFNLKASAAIVQKLNELEESNIWSAESVSYLRDYLEQAMLAEKLASETDKAYQMLYCHYQVLLQENVVSSSCASENFPLQDFKMQNSNIQFLFLNQLKLNLLEQSQVQALPEKTYRWTYLTNQNTAKTVQAKPADFLSRKLEIENAISGDCTEFDKIQDLKAPSDTVVFFAPNCQRPLSEAGLKVSWYKKNRYLLMGLAAVAAGVYLHDKTVVITLPNF